MDNIKDVEYTSIEDIVVRDAATGKILKKYKFSENEFLAKIKTEYYEDKNEK